MRQFLVGHTAGGCEGRDEDCFRPFEGLMDVIEAGQWMRGLATGL